MKVNYLTKGCKSRCGCHQAGKNADQAVIVTTVCTKISLSCIDMNVKIEEITLEKNKEETSDNDCDDENVIL